MWKTVYPNWDLIPGPPDFSGDALPTEQSAPLEFYLNFTKEDRERKKDLGCI